MKDRAYIDPAKLGDVFTRLLPHQIAGLSYTATGYGSKIPTTKMAQYNGREYRVYCMIYSNIGTCYITVKGCQLIIPDYCL